jgi:hypothetical protein
LHHRWLTDYLIASGAAGLAVPGEVFVSPLSPASADAFYLLRDDLYAHLDGADCLATQDNDWSSDEMQAARGLIGDLVLVIRGLLIEHKVQPSGDCRICTSVWPCPVVVTIHAIVKDPERQFVAHVLRDHEGTDRPGFYLSGG